MWRGRDGTDWPEALDVYAAFFARLPRFASEYRRRSRSRPIAKTFQSLLALVPFWQRSTSANRRGSIRPLPAQSVVSAAIRPRSGALSYVLFPREDTRIRWSRLGQFGAIRLTGGQYRFTLGLPVEASIYVLFVRLSFPIKYVLMAPSLLLLVLWNKGASDMESAVIQHCCYCAPFCINIAI